MLDGSAVAVLFSTCWARPSAVGAVCRNKRPKNKTAPTDVRIDDDRMDDDRTELHRDIGLSWIRKFSVAIAT